MIAPGTSAPAWSRPSKAWQSRYSRAAATPSHAPGNRRTNSITPKPQPCVAARGDGTPGTEGTRAEATESRHNPFLAPPNFLVRRKGNHEQSHIPGDRNRRNLARRHRRGYPKQPGPRGGDDAPTRLVRSA